MSLLAFLDPQVQLALISAVATVVAIGLPLRANAKKVAAEASKTQAEVQVLQASVATNHGKRPGEYLEMVMEVRDGQEEIRQGQLEMRSEMSALVTLLAEHTSADAANFAQLQLQMQGVQDGQRDAAALL